MQERKPLLRPIMKKLKMSKPDIKPKPEKAGKTASKEEQERLNSNLQAATSRGNNEDIARLIKAGADIAAKRNGWTLLQNAASSGYTQSCALLLDEYAKAGGDIKKFIAAKDSTGWTAMYCAAKNGYAETVWFLAAKLLEAMVGKEISNSFMASFSKCLAS